MAVAPRRTHAIQVMTEDGSYLLCYSSEASATLEYDKIKLIAPDLAHESPWLELFDDEATRLFIRVDSLHSVAFAPVPEAPTLASIFNLQQEKVN